MTAPNPATTAATRSTAMCSSTVSAIACRLPPSPRASVAAISTAETIQLIHHADGERRRVRCASTDPLRHRMRAPISPASSCAATRSWSSVRSISVTIWPAP